VTICQDLMSHKITEPQPLSLPDASKSPEGPLTKARQQMAAWCPFKVLIFLPYKE